MITMNEYTTIISCAILLCDCESFLDIPLLPVASEDNDYVFESVVDR